MNTTLKGRFYLFFGFLSVSVGLLGMAWLLLSRRAQVNPVLVRH